MKRITASILLISYFAATAGVVVNFHYCMDRLASTQLFGAERKKCGKCGMHISKSNGCCHDEVKVVKLKVDHNNPSPVVFELTSPAIDSHAPSAFIATSFYNAGETRDYQNHSPPLLTPPDIYLQNGVFRI